MEEAKSCLLQRFSLVSFLLSLALLFSATLFLAAPAKASPRWQEDQITVNHSIDKVIPLLTACKDYKHIFRHVTRSRAIASDQCYIEAKILKQTFWVHIKISRPSTDADGKTVRIFVRRVKGSVKAFEVKLRLSDLGGNKTHIVMRMRADPGMPVPDSLVESQVGGVIHRALVRLSMRLLVGRY